MKTPTIALIASLMLTACAATGTAYQPHQPSAKDVSTANVVIYRSSISLYAPDAIVTVGKKTFCPLERDGFVSAKLPAGTYDFAIHKDGENYTSKNTFTVTEDHITYIRAEMIDKVAAFGVLGARLVANANGTSIFKLSQGNETEARDTAESTCQ